MKIPQTLQTLTQYGLTDRQAKVYIACLELGVASVQEISRKVHIARSSCEATINQLLERGFVTSYQHKTVRKFSPVDPRQIVKVAEQKVGGLINALPDLTGIFLKNKTIPSVRLYEGKKAMESILEEILAEAKVLHGFGSADDLYDALGETFPEFRKRRIQKKIPARMILRNTAKARQRQKMGPQELREVRLLGDDTLDVSSLVFIWNDKVASFSLRQEMIAVIVESREMATGQMAMFDSLWKTLPAYTIS